MTFGRRLQPKVAVDLTPLIDVVFQLVIFFMITSVFKVAPGIPLALPESGTAQSTSITDLRVAVVNADEIYVGETRTTIEGLSQILAQAVANSGGSVPGATVEGDADMPYSLAIAVLDALREAGVADASLMTRPRDR
jgi:biopolymer transport protein ExbD